MIEPTTDAAWVNSVLNHPAVRPGVADSSEGVIDVSEQLALPRVLALRGEHGVFLVFKLDVGIWECHTAVLPPGRGEWAREFARDGADFMFYRTDAVEILTRVPEPHAAARKLTLDTGFRLQFTTLPETRFRGDLVPVEVYSLSLQEWAAATEGVVECGKAFHQWLNEQVRTYSSGRVSVPHPDDVAHNRVVGVAIEMIAAGNVAKGIVWYNRWAVLARHPMISLLSAAPVQIRFDAGILDVGADGTISYCATH